MFIGPAGWNMDHDDGSSEYHDYDNIVYQGGFKYRDGINRNMTGNLMVHGATPVFQVFGFSTDYFDANYMWGQTKPLCGPSDIGGLRDNVFISQNDTVHYPNTIQEAARSTHRHGGLVSRSRFEELSHDTCDDGILQNLTLAEIQNLAWKLVGIS